MKQPNSKPMPLVPCIAEAAQAAQALNETIWLLYDVSCNLWAWEKADGDTLSNEPDLGVEPNGSVHPVALYPLEEAMEILPGEIPLQFSKS